MILAAIAAAAFLAVGFLGGIAAGIGIANRAPLCTCGDVECGGGCLSRGVVE